MKDFRTYRLAIRFHKIICGLRLPSYLRNQVLRASSSVALNLSEGSSKPTARDQLKFYHIAFGSLRECQAVLDLAPTDYPTARKVADQLGGCLYRLCQSRIQ